MHSYCDLIHWGDGENVKKVFLYFLSGKFQTVIYLLLLALGRCLLRAVESLAKLLYDMAASAPTPRGQQALGPRPALR